MEKKDFEIISYNNKRIILTLRMPETPRGTALVLHGLGGWREQPVVVSSAEALVDLGYAVVTFDASDGARGPDSDFFNSTTSGYQKDLEVIMAWISMQKELSLPLILAAHSAGALVATRYTALHPDTVAKLILMAPAISWKSGMWMQFPYLACWILTGIRPRWDVKGRDHRRKPLGRSWVLDFFSYDAQQDAACISLPALVVSAEKDHTVAKPLVNKNFAQRFVQGTHVLVANAPHDFLGHTEELTAILKKWLTQS